VPVRRHEIRALVVDYGEVLCHAADPAGLAAMASVVDVEPARFIDAYWQHREAYDRGLLDGAAYWRLVGDGLDIELDDALATELVAADILLWTRFDPEMLAWVDAVVDSGVPVGLLSNMVREIGIHLRDELRLFERFASVTYSYEELLAKPDPAIYERALEGLGVAAEDSLFVDDRAVNVEAARDVGMHAHRFTGRDELVREIDSRYLLVLRA
jgi:putative hydrolase of the HAD superfamily